MFQTGTRVMAVASTTGKKTGPRRGSLGFFQGGHYAGRIEKPAAATVLTSIVFHRYGFENKYRAERKDVLALMPILSPSYGDGSAQVLKLARQIETGSKEMWDSVRKNVSIPKGIPIVLLSPAPNPTNLAEDPETFLSWLHAVVSSEFFRHGVSSLAVDHKAHQDSPFKEEHISWLRRMVGNSGVRRATAKDISLNYRHELLKVLRMVIAMLERHHNLAQAQQYRHQNINSLAYGESIIRNRKLNQLAMYAAASTRLFDPMQFEVMLQLVKAYRHPQVSTSQMKKEVHSIKEEFNQVKTSILGLSACLGRSGQY